MTRKLEMFAAWFFSYFISLGLMVGMTLWEFFLDMFELPFDVWETVKEKYDEYE